MLFRSLFLFYTITFTKHPYQFFYFTRYFNKIFTILNFFIISFNHLSLYARSLSFYPFFCFVALFLHPSLWPLHHQITSGLPLPNHKTHPPSSSTTITKSQPPPNLNHTLTLTHQIRSTTKSQPHSHYPPQSSPTPTTHH